MFSVGAVKVPTDFLYSMASATKSLKVYSVPFNLKY